MEGLKRHNDERGVSPVIGVILMVAITVLLAAGTASFVLGLGEQPSATPQVSFEFDYTQAGTGELSVTHAGGDTLDPARVAITSTSDFNPAPGNSSGSPASGVARVPLDSQADGSVWVDGDMQAGTTFTIVGGSDLDDATVRVVFVGDGGDRTTTLAQWEGPDA
jgi:flagellin-like protein